MVQLADLDADATKDALGALCQVKHSSTCDRCQEELLKKGEDNDTQLNVAVTDVLLCACSLVGDWKGGLLGERNR